MLNACGNVDNDDAGRANTLRSGDANANADAAAPTTKSEVDRIKALHTALQSEELKGNVKSLWVYVFDTWKSHGGPFEDRLFLNDNDLVVVMNRLAGCFGTSTSPLDDLAQQN